MFDLFLYVCQVTCKPSPSVLVSSPHLTLPYLTLPLLVLLGPLTMQITLIHTEALADCLQMDMTLSETVQRVLDQADEEDNGSVGIG